MAGTDDIDSRDFDTKDFGSEDLDEMIVYGNGSAITPEDEKPIPFDDSDDDTPDISHSPLNLGGSTTEMPRAEPSRNIPETRKRAPAEEVSSKAITGVKTFFTKLHPGALAFLDEQISNWLKNNPGIIVKRTDTVTGEIQGKKTEPNLIVTVWY
ncbi:MAG TPA: hypothetical protein HPP87_13350 [Planctomycetes bacterium]|nr:hypothetical protein [Planctomycetota bacterium]